MALSNIFREPRREITDRSLVLLGITTIVLGSTVMLCATGFALAAAISISPSAITPATTMYEPISLQNRATIRAWSQSGFIVNARWTDDDYVRADKTLKKVNWVMWWLLIIVIVLRATEALWRK